MLNRTQLITGLTLLSSFGLVTFGATARAADVDANVDVRGNDGVAEVRAEVHGRRFGNKGQKAVSSDAGLSINNTSVSGVDGSSTTILLRPALDFFIADSFSVGGFVGVEYASVPGGSSSSVSIGPRFGYNLPIAERVSFWPKIGFAIARTSQDNDGAALPDGVIVEEEDNTGVQLNLFAPVMFHPVPHFFLGLGPALDQDLNGDNKATTLAARLTIGGWI